MTVAAKPLLGHTRETGSAARVWEQLTASATPLDRAPRALWCETAGTITCEDAEGNELDFTVAVGVVPLSPTAVTDLGTAVVYALY